MAESDWLYEDSTVEERMRIAELEGKVVYNHHYSPLYSFFVTYCFSLLVKTES